MVTTTRQLDRQPQDSISPDPRRYRVVREILASLQRAGWLAWVIFIAAFVLLNIFTHQAVMIPQERDFSANWQGAQWITVPGSNKPVQYFRKDFALEAPPDNAFLIIEAKQYYSLYVNGQFVDQTTIDVTKSGILYFTNLYDIGPFMHAGANSVAVRTVNQDVGGSEVRALIGVSYGGFQQVFPSDNTWEATDNSALTQSPPSSNGPSWWSTGFNDTSWQSAAYFSGVPEQDGSIAFAPSTYETPLPSTWLTAGPGASAFFFRNIQLPSFDSVWLRIASTGTGAVYLDGTAAITQPPQLHQDQTGATPPLGIQYTAEIYDITPYVHQGTNALAVHVTSAGANPVTHALTQPGAMVLDLIIIAPNGASEQLNPTGNWRASSTSTPGWDSGVGTASWQAASQTSQSSITNVPVYKIAMTGIQAAADEVGTTYPVPDLQQYSFQESLGVFAATTLLLALFCCAGAAVLWLRNSLRGTKDPLTDAITGIVITLAPGTALLGLLIVLSHYPLLPNPFPYTWPWIVAFEVVTCVTFLLVLFFPARTTEKAAIDGAPAATSRSLRWPSAKWLTLAAVLVMAGIGAWMVMYNLGYESFWEDELSSIYAATGVLQHGIPVWPTGYLYTKSELYSYMLAVIIAIFGYNPVALRMLSATEYVLAMLLTFYVARYFFGRRVGLVAMALMLFSPFEIHWAREVRMYQQVQLMALVVIFLFYKAVQPEARIRYIYLSMAAVVVMYLSHEESFILLLPIFLYFLWTKRLTWIRNRHWWIAGLSAIACIAVQLIIWRLTRFPLLGTDRTTVFLLHFSPENINWYLQLFANPASLGVANLVMWQVVTALAIIAAVVGIVRKDKYLRFFSCMVFIPLGILCVILPLTDDRYVYLVLPSMFILDAVMVVRTLNAVGRAARRIAVPRMATVVTVTVTVLVCALVLGSEISSPSNIGLAVSRTLNISFHHYHPDYQYASDYILANWEPGDVLIASAPVNDVAFYAITPNYALYNYQTLYFYEANGQILTNKTGTLAILNVNDLDQVLARYHRVWLISPSTISAPNIGHSGNGPIQQNFTLVFESQTLAVYLFTS